MARKFYHPQSILLLVISFVLFFSCKKEEQKKSDFKTELKFQVAEAKLWFTNNPVQKKAKSITSRTDGTNKVKPFTPQWDKATSAEDENNYVVECPLQFEKSPGFVIADSTNTNTKINGQTRLLVLKDKVSGRLQSVLMHVYSNSGNVDKGITYTNRPDTFSGTVFFSDLNGEFINGWIYEKGRIIKKSKIPGNNTIARLTPVEENNECKLVNTYWYEQTCYYYSDGSESCTDWIFIGTTSQLYCPAVGGSGGVGDNSNTPPPNIVNDVDDPCIHASVENAISLNCKNKISAFINSVYLNSEVYDLYFKDNTLIGDLKDADAYTHTDVIVNGSVTKTTITFNNGQMGSATREYIAATILHEAIHAWIDYKFPVPVEAAEQHNLMASTGRFNMMRDALLEMFPDMSVQDAEDLTWGGLFSTPLFESKSLAEKERIVQKNIDYKKHNANTGTPCQNPI